MCYEILDLDAWNSESNLGCRLKALAMHVHTLVVWQIQSTFPKDTGLHSMPVKLPHDWFHCGHDTTDNTWSGTKPVRMKFPSTLFFLFVFKLKLTEWAQHMDLTQGVLSWIYCSLKLKWSKDRLISRLSLTQLGREGRETQFTLARETMSKACLDITRTKINQLYQQKTTRSWITIFSALGDSKGFPVGL